MFGLKNILAPFSMEDFIDSFLGNRALYIEGPEEKFSQALDWDDINHISQYTRIDGHWANIVENKESRRPNNAAEFNHLLRRGATLVLNSLNQKDLVIDELARQLSADLNMPVNINCYISTPGIQGFDTHYDRHDVFILHLSGKKAWKVFHPTMINPVDKMSKQITTPPEDIEPYLECEMTPGDVLYIPRGHWHYAMSDEHCYHLTAGWTARTSSHFMLWWFSKLIDSDPDWRDNLDLVNSATFGGDRKDVFENCTHRLQERLIKLIKENSFNDLVKEFVMLSNPLTHAPTTQFPTQQLMQDNISPQTRFMLPSGQKIVLRYDEAAQRGQVLSRGGSINIESTPEAVLQAIFQSGWPVCGQQVQDMNPDYEWDKLKKILLLLLDYGIIIMAQD